MGAGTREAERLARQQEEAMEEQPTPLPWKIGEGGTHLYYIDDDYESRRTEDHNEWHDTVIVENGKEADIELIHKAVTAHARLKMIGDVARDYPADEITRDPIFLLQRRIVQYTEMPPGYEYEDGTVYKIDNHEETLDWKEMISRECAVETWYTETVWFTRQEAEGELSARSYRYPEGGRVFCVCCEGQLAKLLKAVTVQPVAGEKV
jgi:hypothetical protein